MSDEDFPFDEGDDNADFDFDAAAEDYDFDGDFKYENSESEEEEVEDLEVQISNCYYTSKGSIQNQLFYTIWNKFFNNIKKFI